MVGDLTSQEAAVAATQSALDGSRDGEVCLEVAKFVESTAQRLHVERHGTEARNAKAAIDHLIDQCGIDRTLGFKLHVVRELRNKMTHEPSYVFQRSDGIFAAGVLNEFLAWWNGASLSLEWNRLEKEFTSGERLLLLERPGAMPASSVETIHRVLEKAVHVKLRSLGIKAGPQFFEAIDALTRNGIDVRSEHWKDLVTARNLSVHAVPGMKHPSADWSLRRAIPELRRILRVLKPAAHGNEVLDNHPKVLLADAPSSESSA